MLVVPLKHPGAFMLVNEHDLALYQVGRTGQFQHCLVEISDSANDDSALRRAPSFTAWTRSMRTDLQEQDRIYLTREDGTLYGLATKMRQGKAYVHAYEKLAQLDLDIDQSITAIARSSKVDLLLVTSSSGVAMYKV